MKQRWFVLFSVVVMLSMLLAAYAGGGAATQSPTEAVSMPTTAAKPTTAMEATKAPTAAMATEAKPTTGATMEATKEATAVAIFAPGTAMEGWPLKVEDGATITFSGWGDETEQKIYRDSIDRFKAVCPGVTVTYNPVPDKFQDKMKAQMAGGTAPDVFYVDDQLMTAFAPSGQLLALDPLMQEEQYVVVLRSGWSCSLPGGGPFGAMVVTPHAHPAPGCLRRALDNQAHLSSMESVPTTEQTNEKTGFLPCFRFPRCLGCSAAVCWGHVRVHR